jgi:catechol 2,3-dioxygenase-like lactoylglutathione lyase family enzyme
MVRFDATIPVLRIFDLAKAREFYVDFLGMTWDWERRFAPDLPVFVQVSRGGLVLFLSEHFGDGTPGAKVMLRMTGLDVLRAELLAKNYRHARPGIEARPWGWRDMPVTDPFGNRLVFTERIAEPA